MADTGATEAGSATGAVPGAGPGSSTRDGSAEPVIEMLADVWARIVSFCAPLTEEEWLTPTDCPGWSVKDNVSHVVGTERMLEGDPIPPLPPDTDLSHVRNPIGEANEAWVVALRAKTGDEVLAAMAETSDARLATLRATPTEGFDEVGWSPIGDVPYRVFMRIRVMDAWVHLQDIRRALGRPGDLTGPAAESALDTYVATLPMVVAKRARAPHGATVAFDVTGPIPTHVVVGVGDDGRASLLDTVPEKPTASITLDLDTLTILRNGRRHPDEVLASGAITVDGDGALADAVIRNLNVMI